MRWSELVKKWHVIKGINVGNLIVTYAMIGLKFELLNIKVICITFIIVIYSFYQNLIYCFTGNVDMAGIKVANLHYNCIVKFK